MLLWTMTLFLITFGTECDCYTLPHINDNLCMCLGIFLETINGSQVTYDRVCQSVKWQYPNTQIMTYDQMM
jgi:hypothetical protein